MEPLTLSSRSDTAAERMIRTALALCAGCGWLVASTVLIENLTSREAWPLAVGCIAWLVFAPLFEADFVTAVRRLPGGVVLSRLVWILEVLPIFLLPAPLVQSVVCGAMMLAQGHLFMASDDDRNAVRCLAAAPLLTVGALIFSPSILLLATLPVSAGAAITALVLVHGRAARNRVRRGATQQEHAGARRKRLVYAAPLALLTLLVATLAYLGLDATRAALVGEDALASEDREPRFPSDFDVSQARPPGAGDGGGDAIGAELGFSEPTSPFSEEVVMTVSPLGDDFAYGVPVFMRDMVLDRFDDTGATLADRTTPTRYTDRSDGVRDGWTHVREPVDPEHEQRFNVVVHRRLMLAEKNWTVLFSPHPLVAIGLPEVRYDPDQVLVTEVLPVADPPSYGLVEDWIVVLSPHPLVVVAFPMVRHDASRAPVVRVPAEEQFSYGLVAEKRDLSGPNLRQAAAVHPREQYVQLPEGVGDVEAVDFVRAEAVRMIGDADTDLDRVMRLVSSLKSEFTYELVDLRFEGANAIAEFLRAKSGYCTHFASAATLMLRTQGIAARIATGFVAHEWSPDHNAYVVREKDAHAWMEVYFDGVGWVTFDPTPVREGEWISSDFDPFVEEQLGWFEEVWQRVEDWLSTGGSLGSVFAALLSTPLAFLADHPAIWLVVIAGFLFAIDALRRGRGSKDGRLFERKSLPRPTLRLFQRLEIALSALGYHRRRGETPREFAGAVIGEAGEALHPLAPITEVYYRVRFGGRPLTAEEKGRIETFVAHLHGIRRESGT